MPTLWDTARTLFPTNIVEVSRDFILPLLSVENVYRRVLRPEDPNSSVGIVAVDWEPGEYLIGQEEPALSMYHFSIQSLVKHGNEEEGLTHHSLLAKNLAHLLYRDAAFRVALLTLNAEVMGVKESARRMGVRQQRYRSNEIDGEWLFVSTTEMWVQTESIKL